MATYWAMVAAAALFGVYYLVSAFVPLPDWAAPRRFPRIFMLLTAVLPDRWELAACRILFALVCFFLAGVFGLQALKIPH